MENLVFFVSALTVGVSAVLAIVLSIGSKLAGRNWLIASLVLELVVLVSSRIVQSIITWGDFDSFEDRKGLFPLYDLTSMTSFYAIACLGVFLLVNWSASRVNLDVKNLLFSFSGRIPRSIFWISIVMLTSLGTSVSATAGVSEAEGILRVLVLAVYGSTLLLGTWISLAVYAKRWHDCSKSGWMSLIMFIPVLGIIGLIGYLGLVGGSKGANNYGENPLRNL